MTHIVQIRLNGAELGKLDVLVVGGRAGTASRCELFRLLLHREWNRRHNLPKPKPSDWQTVFRVKNAKINHGLRG